MAAIANTLISNILNATLPTNTTIALPSTWTAFAATPMKLRLNSGTSTGAAAGTELPSVGAGYVTGGTAFSSSSTASSSGSNVAMPATAAITWTNASTATSPWTIASLDITDGSAARSWFGLFNGQPITVAPGNQFQVAVGGITVSLT
jgi:hypothetical protein